MHLGKKDGTDMLLGRVPGRYAQADGEPTATFVIPAIAFVFFPLHFTTFMIKLNLKQLIFFKEGQSHHWALNGTVKSLLCQVLKAARNNLLDYLNS